MKSIKSVCRFIFFLFCMWMSSCSNITHWDLPFTIKLTLLLVNSFLRLCGFISGLPNLSPSSDNLFFGWYHTLDNCSFIVSLRSQIVLNLQCSSFPSILCWLFWVFSLSIQTLDWICWHMQNDLHDLDWDYVKSIDQVGKNWYLDKILSVPIHKYGTYLYLFRSFFFDFLSSEFYSFPHIDLVYFVPVKTIPLFFMLM